MKLGVNKIVSRCCASIQITCQLKEWDVWVTAAFKVNFFYVPLVALEEFIKMSTHYFKPRWIIYVVQRSEKNVLLMGLDYKYSLRSSNKFIRMTNKAREFFSSLKRERVVYAQRSVLLQKRVFVLSIFPFGEFSFHGRWVVRFYCVLNNMSSFLFL